MKPVILSTPKRRRGSFGEAIDPFERAIEDASSGRWRGSEVFAERVSEVILEHQERPRIEALWRLGKVDAAVLVSKLGELFCDNDAAEVREGGRGVRFKRRSMTRRRRERRQIAALIEELLCSPKA